MTWDDLDLRKLEAEAFLASPGSWKNFEELEKSLTLAELEAILEAYHEVEYRNHKFSAALQGINLDGGESQQSNKERFDAIKRRVEARQSGVSEESHELSEMGIDTWDDF